MNKLKITKIAAVAMGLAVAGQVAQAGLFNVDYGTSGSSVYGGAGVLGASGDQWNGISSSGSIAISDSTGSSAASVTVNTANMNAWSDWAATGVSTLMEDYACFPGYNGGDPTGWPVEVSLAGLPVSTAFTLVVYSAGNTPGQGSTINLTDSSFLDSTITQTATANAADRNIGDAAGVCWVEFNGITSATGTIDFDVAGLGTQAPGNIDWNTWHALNGFQLEVTAVPEPSSMALCGGGLVLLGLFRRRLSR